MNKQWLETFPCAKDQRQHAEISRKVKMNISKNLYVPVLTFGVETWALTKNHLNSLQGMEMRYLRKVEGKTRRDRARMAGRRPSDMGGQCEVLSTGAGSGVE